jgi:hypothetical protein
MSSVVVAVGRDSFRRPIISDELLPYPLSRVLVGRNGVVASREHFGRGLDLRRRAAWVILY